uniref:Uncharacterized protein n=1 Tax=Anopheles culicifacies TaxID=139723 RepID=A0A182M9S2_9DIPT
MYPTSYFAANDRHEISDQRRDREPSEALRAHAVVKPCQPESVSVHPSYAYHPKGSMRHKVTVRDGGLPHVPRTAMLVQLIVGGLLLATVWHDRTATAFNLDTINYILHEGDPNSMFGFSVVLHREQNKSCHSVCLLALLHCAVDR